MKNFDNFLDSITQTDVDEMAKTFNEIISDENLNLGTKLASQQYVMTIHLLHRYHDWLQASEGSDE